MYVYLCAALIVHTLSTYPTALYILLDESLQKKGGGGEYIPSSI